MKNKLQHAASVAGKTDEKKKRLHLAILKQMVTLSTSGFGLVAALAWNTAIQEFVSTFIKPYLPKSSGFISLIIYAVLITVIAVVVTVNLSRITEELEK